MTQINLASIQLMGVAPLRSNLKGVGYPFIPLISKQDVNDCNDFGMDGFTDPTLKFNTQEVVQAIETMLGREVEDGEVVVLPLTGNLKEELGGTAIQGEERNRMSVREGRVKTGSAFLSDFPYIEFQEFSLEA